MNKCPFVECISYSKCKNYYSCKEKLKLLSLGNEEYCRKFSHKMKMAVQKMQKTLVKKLLYKKSFYRYSRIKIRRHK